MLEEASALSTSSLIFQFLSSIFLVISSVSLILKKTRVKCEQTSANFSSLFAKIPSFLLYLFVGKYKNPNSSIFLILDRRTEDIIASNFEMFDHERNKIFLIFFIKYYWILLFDDSLNEFIPFINFYWSKILISLSVQHESNVFINCEVFLKQDSGVYL